MLKAAEAPVGPVMIMSVSGGALRGHTSRRSWMVRGESEEICDVVHVRDRQSEDRMQVLGTFCGKHPEDPVSPTPPTPCDRTPTCVERKKPNRTRGTTSETRRASTAIPEKEDEAGGGREGFFVS